MLCISLHLNSQYASQQIKMQKAETVRLLISIAKQIDQIPLQSYCCEVVMEETYLVLRGRFSKVLNLSSPVGFSDGLCRHHVPLKCENFSTGLFQQLLWRKMGFLCVKKIVGKCCCFILGYRTEEDSFIYSLDHISYLLCLTCLPALQYFLPPLGSYLDLVMAILYEMP